jgi:hypothetical protein
VCIMGTPEQDGGEESLLEGETEQSEGVGNDGIDEQTQEATRLIR